MKYITFSQKYPAYHPKKGEPTFFVEKILTNLISLHLPIYGSELLKQPMVDIKGFEWNRSKNHTVRGGKRWKVGEWFNPRIWSGKPYHSKMVSFAPAIEIKKIWDIEITINAIDPGKKISRKNGNDCYLVKISDKQLTDIWIDCLADNDGLFPMDFLYWFDTHPDIPFIGQIICWDENVIYPGDPDYNPEHYYS